ncbi:MAG: hypothetical protein Q8K85_03240, partial [Hyphomicrobium sp.]|nr:hypothetical protein [Hyphomicrobium sp.]
MNRSSLVAALAGALLFGSVAASRADEEPTRELLPFSRQIAVAGTITDSLEASTATSGVPASAMVEALQAFASSIDLDREVRDGDSFHVRYERTFIAEGVPIGPGRVLWAELRTAAKGTVAIHRFRTRDGAEHFWLANGQGAAPPSMR